MRPAQQAPAVCWRTAPAALTAVKRTGCAFRRQDTTQGEVEQGKADRTDAEDADKGGGKTDSPPAPSLCPNTERRSGVSAGLRDACVAPRERLAPASTSAPCKAGVRSTTRCPGTSREPRKHARCSVRLSAIGPAVSSPALQPCLMSADRQNGKDRRCRCSASRRLCVAAPLRCADALAFDASATNSSAPVPDAGGFPLARE